MNFYSFYGFIALITSCIFVIQFILGLIGGIGDSLDIDVDADADTDVDVDSDGGAGFELSSLMSPKGFLHFLLGGSWYLVLAEYVRGNVTWYDYLIAIGVGFLTALMMGLLYWVMMKLESKPKQEEGLELVGRSGEIYLSDSERNRHVINVVISGSKTDLTTKSKSGKAYKIGELVTIVEYKDGIYYID